jgi:hypothetical protein
VFGLGQSVAEVTVNAIGANTFDDTSRIDTSLDKCGTNTTLGYVDCASFYSNAQYNDGQHLVVYTADSYANTSGLNDEGFYIDFIG